MIVDEVRVWDTVGEENILKGEYPAIGGKMYALKVLNRLSYF